MHIEIPEGNLVACLQIEGTCIFLDTLTTSNCELDTLPHVVMMSHYPWVPQNFKLPKFSDSLKEEVDIRRVASVSSIRYNLTFEFLDRKHCRELNGFCDIEGLPEDTPGEDNVLINFGEVYNRII